MTAEMMTAITAEALAGCPMAHQADLATPPVQPVNVGTEVIRLSKRILMLVALAVAGSWSVPVHAQSPEAAVEMVMMGDGPILVLPVLLRFADLTTRQTDQAHRIIETGRIDAQKFLSQLAEANNHLDDALLGSADVPARDSGAIIQRLAQLRLQFMQSELKTVLAIRRILTPEQLAKVSDAMNEMKKAGPDQLEPHPQAF